MLDHLLAEVLCGDLQGVKLFCDSIRLRQHSGAQEHMSRPSSFAQRLPATAPRYASFHITFFSVLTQGESQ